MTKFEELETIISRKRNIDKAKNSEVNDGLEFAGAETSKTPLLSCGDDIDDNLVNTTRTQRYGSCRSYIPISTTIRKYIPRSTEFINDLYSY